MKTRTNAVNCCVRSNSKQIGWKCDLNHQNIKYQVVPLYRCRGKRGPKLPIYKLDLELGRNGT